jgi:hypothetical protein
MSTATGPWLAALIQAHIEDLAEALGEAARRDIPFYQAIPPQQVQHLFRALYQAVAATVEAGDLLPMRTHLEQITAARIRAGVAASSYIALVPLSQANLLALIERDGSSDRALKADAIRVVQSIHTNARLMLSEINLRLLSHPGSAD